MTSEPLDPGLLGLESRSDISVFPSVKWGLKKVCNSQGSCAVVGPVHISDDTDKALTVCSAVLIPPGASLVVQMVKNLPAIQETQV